MMLKKIQKQLKKISLFVKNNRQEAGLIFLILVIAAFMRLYRINDYMTFLGDEGRDALVVKKIIVDHKPTLLGPTASVGGFFLGPIYYYLMIPFLWAFRLNPVGPAVMVALFGVVTVFLIYHVGRSWFSARAGLLAALFYSISPVIIATNRSSWNPNIMPFFSLLAIYHLWLAVSHKKMAFLGLVGFWVGIAFQLHYLAIFLAVIILVYLGLFAREAKHLKYYLLGLAGFVLAWSPFILFELRHQFPNLKSLYQFIFFGKETGLTRTEILPKLGEIVFRLFSRLIAYGQSVVGWLSAGLGLGGLAWVVFKERFKNSRRLAVLLIVWLLLGVGLFGFYRKDVYDHYLGFMFPLPFFLVALGLDKIGTVNKFGRLLLISLIIWLVGVNLSGIPFQHEPNRQVLQTQRVAESIIERAGGKPFNFALITGQNSDHAYRYFLEISGNPPVVIENPQVDPERNSVTDQLFVACEVSDCQPLGHSLWEIAGFGRAEIESQWQSSVIKVYKLGHWPGEE